MAKQRNYWLFKSEPDVYSFADLQREGKTYWNGVRNFQARNLLRDQIAVGDGVLYYHSNAKPMAIVGVAKVVKGGYPDHTAFDPSTKYFDPKSDRDDPTWFMVDIAPVVVFPEPLTRDVLKAAPELDGMMLLARGSRLSVQPVSVEHWNHVIQMAGVKPRL